MLFSLVIPLITLGASFVIEYSTLTMRWSLRTHILMRTVAVAYFFSAYFFLNYLGIKDFLFYYLANFFHLLVCFFLFKERIPQKVFLFFTTWTLTTFISTLGNWGAAFAQEDQRLILRHGLYFLAYIIFLPLYIKYWSHQVKELLYHFNKGSALYALYPFMVFVLYTILFGPLNRITTLSGFISMILFFSVVVFTYFLMGSHFRVVFTHTKSQVKLEEIQRQMAMDRKYYEEIDKGVRTQRQQIHDTRHHLVAMAAMGKVGNYEAIGNHVSGLLDYYSAIEPIYYCENSVVNGVIGGYLRMAQDKGITVKASIDIPQDIQIDEFDLCTLFGNTIENAMEACQRIPQESTLFLDRFINIKTKTEKGRLVIRIENPFLPNPEKLPNPLGSSKGSRGGIGLESVKTVIDRYQGSMNCESQGNLFVFSAVLCQM